MDISPELKKRFVQDCCIPIDIFTEPVFASRIQLFDRFYNTMERYNVFLEMLKHRFTTYEMESKTTVTTYRKGNVVVTAQSKSDPSVKKECYVSIIDSSDNDKVDSLTLDYTDIYLSVGGSKQLYATILPENLEDKRILWGTSDKALATVSGGVVTALTKTEGDQICTITAMSNKDKSKTATCTVHITDPQYVEGLDFVYHQTELEMGAKERLKVNAVPATATSTDILWSSSNPSVATVLDGVVTAVSPGSCAITAKSSADPKIQDVCYILVHNIVPVGSVLFIDNDGQPIYHRDIIVGGLDRLPYRILPEKATNKEVVWESSDTSVLQVDPKDGLITAIGRGTASIYARAVYDYSKYAECVYDVKPSLFVRDIELDTYAKEIDKEQTFDVVSTISVGYDVDPTVQWISSYEMLATVSNDDDTQPTQKSVTVHAQDYYNEYDRVKCKIVRHIKTSSGYSRFNNINVEKDWPVNCLCSKATIYTPEMDGHTMISIKIDKPLFTPLYHFDPSIFDNLNAWENVVSTIGETDNDHIIYSENLLKEVAECCNLSRIQSYGRYILNGFYTSKVKPLIDALGKDIDNEAFASLVYFGTDEMVIDTSKLTQIIDLDSSDAKVVCTNRLIKLFNDIKIQAAGYNCSHDPCRGGFSRFPLTVQLFTLYKLKTEYTDEEGNTVIDASQIDGYVRNIYFEGNQPIEFIANDICQLPILMRAFSYQAIQDDDRKFLHRGLIAEFTDDRKIHVPPITSIPDTPYESPKE